MWIFYVALVAAAFSGSLDAFPQNDVPPTNTLRTSQVDGFVFDGLISSNGRTTRATTTTGSTTTVSTTTVSSTTTAGTNAGDNAECLKRCPTTFEYNPVCGTDIVLYQNPGHLNCAAVCGKDVRINYFGPCQSSGARG